MQKRDVVILEAIRLLEMGKRVVLPVSGRSMLPFIIGGKESVELVKANSLKPYDVVLAWVDNTHYVVHRIIKIEDGLFSLMGDGNLCGIEQCLITDIAAIAEFIVDNNGKHHYLYTPSRKLAASLWNRLLPVRRWLLAVYRRTYFKLKYNEN